MHSAFSQVSWTNAAKQTDATPERTQHSCSSAGEARGERHEPPGRNAPLSLGNQLEDFSWDEGLKDVDLEDGAGGKGGAR